MSLVIFDIILEKEDS